MLGNKVKEILDFTKYGKQEIICIIFASILFILGMFFKTRLHSTPYALGEYLVFLSAYF